ncbi:hypothetical protein POM88_001123 [Heracleum sosnowskyi]|uniref:Uncharacterized protein n=1 Tax=Heracleum sosnowskyi TaxID=360622 RepID=A0AAD8JEA9_9APIA|nr:hypothetical protein POM88_001123 [Heracleum sosnowskyi]
MLLLQSSREASTKTHSDAYQTRNKKDLPRPTKENSSLNSQILISRSSARMQHTPSANISNSPLTSYFASSSLAGQISRNSVTTQSHPVYNKGGRCNEVRHQNKEIFEIVQKTFLFSFSILGYCCLSSLLSYLLEQKGCRHLR